MKVLNFTPPTPPHWRGIHEKHKMRLWILLRTELFAPGLRRIAEKPNRFDRRQELLGGALAVSFSVAHWLSAFGWRTGSQPAGGPSSTRNVAAGPKFTVLLSCVNFGVHTL